MAFEIFLLDISLDSLDVNCFSRKNCGFPFQVIRTLENCKKSCNSNPPKTKAEEFAYSEKFAYYSLKVLIFIKVQVNRLW